MSQSGRDSFVDGMAEPIDVVAALTAFAQLVLIEAVDNGAAAIDIKAVDDPAFTASVVLHPLGDFGIDIAAGVARDLIGALADPPAGVLETLQALAEEVFGSPDEIDVMRGCLVSSALLFVILHEYGHVAAGHFGLLASAERVAFDELTTRFGFNGAPSGMEVNRQVELEADLLGFNLLLDLSYPLFESNEDVQALLGGRELPGWRDGLVPALGELMFYGASLALALIDVHRSGAEDDDYPRPFTRILNLASLLFRRTVRGDWRSDQSEHRLFVDADVQAQLSNLCVPALANALELCEAGVGRLGLDLRQRLRLDSADDAAWISLANDFINLIRGAPKPFVTEDGRQLQRLTDDMPRYQAFMAPHRVRDWWR